MEEQKNPMKLFDKSCLDPSHLIGEVNFIRRENDLIYICINVLQSTKIIMQTIKLLKGIKLPESSFDGYIKKLKKLIAKIMKHINIIFTLLGQSHSVCIPATCITLECVRKILTGIIIHLYSFFEDDITENSMIYIIAQVFFIKKIDEQIRNCWYSY